MGPTRVQPLDTCEDLFVGEYSTKIRDSNGPKVAPHVSKCWTRVEGLRLGLVPFCLFCCVVQVLAKKKPHVSSPLDTCGGVFAHLSP